jgi:hypothetical protein
MKRATICTEADTPERQIVADWLDKWQAELRYCSSNEGCGCCVDLYNVEAPEEALAELPPSVFASSEWAGL